MENLANGHKPPNLRELANLLRVVADNLDRYGAVRSELAAQAITHLQGLVLAMSIEAIECSVRVYNVLKRENIRTLGQLAEYSESDLKEFRNFGRKCLEEVKGILTLYNIRLAERPRRKEAICRQE